MNLLETIIETENLRLLPIDTKWAEDIFREFTEEITRFMYPKPPELIEETLEFINNSKKELAQGINLVIVITKKDTEEFLGCGGLHNVNTPTPEPGIWIKKGAHGKGYGFETVTGLINWARENLNFESFKYPVDKRNIGSRRIPEIHGGVPIKEYTAKGMGGNELSLVEYMIPR